MTTWAYALRYGCSLTILARSVCDAFNDATATGIQLFRVGANMPTCAKHRALGYEGTTFDAFPPGRRAGFVGAFRAVDVASTQELLGERRRAAGSGRVVGAFASARSALTSVVGQVDVGWSRS
jgi:hypothetical protein